MQQLVRAIEKTSRACGVIAAVLVIALIILMLYDVVLRYVFNAPSLWAFDINTWLMGAAFVLSIAYALSKDAHVRVDLLYSPATRHRLRYVDLIGFVFILLPTSAWITWGLWHYFYEALMTGEKSGTSAWNPVLWPFRFILFAGFLVFTLQIVAEIVKRLAAIAGRPLEGDETEDHASV
jgi:TRAP-type mannitol/chloroaromatic compound transport system permease small subunit